MSNKLGIGLVGLGMAGRTHAREIAHLDGGSIAAVFGRNEERVNVFADQFGIPNRHTDYERFLADPSVEIVDVLTPHGAHLEYAVPAAEAGKHVIVEKPLELDLERATAIIDACQRNHVTLGVVYQMRFGGSAQRLKQAVVDGEFGELILADAIEKAYRNPDYYARDPWRGTQAMEGSGCLMTQSIHIIDLLQWIAGPVVSVNAQTRTSRHQIEVADLAIARLTYKSGAWGTVQSSTAIFPPLRSRVEVHGMDGTAILSPEYDDISFWETTGSPTDAIDAPAGFKFKDTSNPTEFPEIRHRLALADILDAIENRSQPLISGSEALKSLAIVLAIDESARTGEDALVADVW